MALIEFQQKPVIAEYPVGHEEFGYLWLPKLFDWTIAEKEWIEELFKKHGIMERLEATVAFAENLVEKNNEREGVLDSDVAKNLATRVLALDPDSEDFSDELIEAKRISELVTKGAPRYTAEQAVLKVLDEDMEFMSNNYVGMISFGKEQTEAQEMRQKILACAMLKFRYVKDPTEFDLEQFETEIKEGRLPYKIREALAKFAEGERGHWTTQSEADLQDQMSLKKRLLELKAKESKAAAAVEKSKQTGKSTSGA